jgi:hypothetical protein
MRKTTWQLNYKPRSKKSCVTILQEVRSELPERLSTGFGGRITSFVFLLLEFLSQLELSKVDQVFLCF